MWNVICCSLWLIFIRTVNCFLSVVFLSVFWLKRFNAAVHRLWWWGWDCGLDSVVKCIHLRSSADVVCVLMEKCTHTHTQTLWVWPGVAWARWGNHIVVLWSEWESAVTQTETHSTTERSYFHTAVSFTESGAGSVSLRSVSCCSQSSPTSALRSCSV